MSWYLGEYEKMRQQGKTIRRYPNGNDPLKQELFGETKTCSKCGSEKIIFKFHWKSDYYKGKLRRRLQAECNECRELQRHTKYSATPEAFIMRSVQTIAQQSARKKRRKRVALTMDQFMEEWRKQFKKYGLICPLSGQEMTYQQGLGNLETNISIDRIDSSKIYEPGNIQFICRRVNSMKNHFSNHDLVFWSRAIAVHHDA